jgi:hypothetical protein
MDQVHQTQATSNRDPELHFSFLTLFLPIKHLPNSQPMKKRLLHPLLVPKAFNLIN